MNRYRVDVVASYPLDADILGAFARAPKTPAGIPELRDDSSGLDRRGVGDDPAPPPDADGPIRS